MIKPRFTKNKQVVRDLQGDCIKKYFGDKLGDLVYFGLPSDEMKDVIDWGSFFSKIVAVERGSALKPWMTQHNLMLNAFKFGLLDKVTLLRGDIDHILLNGIDEYGIKIDYQYDVITLDYSGGLLYRNGHNEQYRLKAIRKLIEMQAKSKHNYLFFVSTNLDNCADGEIKKSLEDIRTELKRARTNGDKVIGAYLNHPKAEARLKIYIPYFVRNTATGYSYNVHCEKVIFYLGNKNTHMMNFRFFFKYDPRTTAPRFPQTRLSQIINSPMIEIKRAVYKETSLGLPKLRRV